MIDREEKKEFNVGDEVWFVHNNIPKKSKIRDIYTPDEYNINKIIYSCDGLHLGMESIFHTPEELLTHITKQIEELKTDIG